MNPADAGATRLKGFFKTPEALKENGHGFAKRSERLNTLFQNPRERPEKHASLRARIGFETASKLLSERLTHEP
ncbi:MAG: hypothetical protein KJ057_07095 [Phycisphaerae bacterium]|nr:hypothetical protein [Planctomycetia bacterium]MCL4718227.1 hypothetical protein [Phycisphaerae bacterium]